jgi:beta-1,4-mannosyl-glycoprotein beta-1,4-N-acetylglucosaminyltransferase
MKWFALFLTLFQLSAAPKVYDCFLFFNELEILDIRLHEMGDYVDRFILVESVETFRGDPKPLYFKENSHLFEPFKDKIIHVIVENRFKTNNPWDREAYQRNQIMRGLIGCDPDATILISDVDEIVKGEEIQTISAALEGKRRKFVGVLQPIHAYFINAVPSPWRGTVAAQYNTMKASSPQRMRDIRNEVISVANGWHFSWMGGLERELYKTSSCSHVEHDTPKKRAKRIKEAENRHLTPIMDIDNSFPKYVRDNQEYLEQIGFVLKRGI